MKYTIYTRVQHVSWFLQCRDLYRARARCTVKTMVQLTCTDRPYKANHQSAPECLGMLSIVG